MQSSKAKEYIAAGDIFQVVLAQRFEVDLQTSPFEIYRALRIVNPSPYMYFLKMPDATIVGSSPEMLVKIQGREVSYRPIAGTRPRGANEVEDERLAEELARRRKGAGRAHHARRPRPQRSRPRLQIRNRSCRRTRCSSSGIRTSCTWCRRLKGRAARRRRPLGYTDGLFPGRHRFRRAKSARDGNHRRVGTDATRRVFRRDHVCGFQQQSRFVHRDPDAGRRAATRVTSRQAAGIVADSVPESEYTETVNKSRALIRAIKLAQRWV